MTSSGESGEPVRMSLVKCSVILCIYCVCIHITVKLCVLHGQKEHFVNI